MKRIYPDHPIVGVGGVIVCDGKVLLEKRKGKPGKGKWTIPGGLVELGERAEETVVREVKEETNLGVCQPELIDVVNNISVDGKGDIRYHFVIVDYFVKLVDGILSVETLEATDDAEELRLVRFDDVERYDLTNSFRDFFRRNRQKLEKLDSCPDVRIK